MPAPVAGDTAAGWRLSDSALLAAVIIAGLCLYLVRLSAPNGYSFDEVYHAWTSAQLVAGNRDAYLWNTYLPSGSPPNVAYEWTHPALSKLFMQAGIHLLGDRPAGWRLFSATFGAAGAGILFLLARTMFNRVVALFAAALLLMDGLWFVMARIAMNDVYVTTFLLLAYLFFFHYLQGPAAERQRYIWLVGIALGLAAATKWSSAYSFAIIGGLVALREAHDHLVGRACRQRVIAGSVIFAGLCAAILMWQRVPPRWSVAWALLLTAAGLALLETTLAAISRRTRWPGPATTWFGALVILPAIVYVAAYFQFFTMRHSPSQFVELQRQMYQYHSSLKATHPWASRWWTWPLVLRPVWFYSGRSQGRRVNVFALANPLIWWAFLPVAAYAILRWSRAGPPLLTSIRRPSWLLLGVYEWVCERAALTGLALALIGFFGQWLPWALSPRISFMYHMLPSVPFGCLLIAYALDRLQAPRVAILGFLLPVLVAFVYFYPLYSALPVSPSYTAQHYWMASWSPG